MNESDNLRLARKEAEEKLLKLDGVTGVDISSEQEGESKGDMPKIIVYVVDKNKALASQALPKEIKGIPIEVVERSFVLH